MPEGARSVSDRILNSIARMVMPVAADDQQLMQEVQVITGSGEQHTGVEHWQPYGRTHNPLPPTGQQYAEALIAYVGGHRSHPVVIAIADRRYRLGGLQPGEGGTFDDQGQQHIHHRSGTLHTGLKQHYNRRQIVPNTTKNGSLNPVLPYSSGQLDWSTVLPLAYSHIDQAVKQVQHPQQVNHHIISGLAIPPNLGNAAAAALQQTAGQMSAAVSQIVAQVTAGTGLPTINNLGSQIQTLATNFQTMAGSTSVTNGIAGQVAALAEANMTSASTINTGVVSAAGVMQQMMSRMMALLPAGVSQIIHRRESSLIDGILHSFQQGQTQTTHDSNGKTITTSNKHTTNAAGGIWEHGDAHGSDNYYLSKDYFGAAYDVNSDRRLKSNHADHEPVLEKIMQLKVRRFDVAQVRYHPNEETLGHDVSIHGDPPRPSRGFFADELREVFPDIVHGDEATEFLSVSEHKLGVIAIKGLQELAVEVRRLHDLITAKGAANGH